MAVWGRAYLDLFLDISLPSQLSEKNIPSIAGDGEILYKIYTMKGDGDYIRRHPAFQKLKGLVATEIIEVDLGDQEDKFSPLMRFHNRAIEEADRENAALFFLSPDFVLADGALSQIMTLKHRGYRAVMVLTLRMVRETGGEELRNRFYSPENQTLRVSSRELVEVGIRHLHAIERSYYWAPGLTSFPIHAYWPVNDEGLLARCFYLHPIMVNPLVRFISPRITIDADYIDRACPNSSDIYVVRDSDELACFELSQKDMGDANAEIRAGFPVSAWNYAKWAVVNANPFYDSLHHHWFFQMPIRVHKGPFSSEWAQVERVSSKVARRVRMSALLHRGRAGLGQAMRFYFSTKAKRPRKEGLLKRVNLCLAEEFFGTGWGKIDSNEQGQRWRFLGPDGTARLVLSIRPGRSYIFKTLVHTAPVDVINRLEVAVNGRETREQQIMNHRGNLWHWCIIPRDVIALRGGRLEVTYRIRGTDHGNLVALSKVICRPLKWYQGDRYREFRRRLGR